MSLEVSPGRGGRDTVFVLRVKKVPLSEVSSTRPCVPKEVLSLIVPWVYTTRLYGGGRGERETPTSLGTEGHFTRRYVPPR